MTVKDRVLAALEAHRGEALSGERLARDLGVSRAAVWKAIDQLRAAGHQIDAQPRRGYLLAQESHVLSAQSVAQWCAVPGLSIEVRDTVDSTNTVLRAQAEAGAPEGTVLIADHQTAGRGRRTNGFFSPPGTGLYLSVLLRPQLEAKDALCLTTAAAAAVALAIEDVAQVPAQIKWVNDVFCHGRKVCGILTEAALDLESGGLSYAVVGLGVNLCPPEGGLPPELEGIAGAVFADRAASDAQRSRLAGRILERFFAYYRSLPERPFFADYRARSFVLGQPIDVLEGGGSRPATALDLGEDFSLRIREADGTERWLGSGQVRIRPKG